MVSESIRIIVEKCTAPIPGDNPCGEPARYDPDYEQARAEVQKMTAMSSPLDAIDWNKVVECSTRVLSEKSKDLTVSAYLCVGLVMTDSYGGLTGGLEIIGGLLEQYWDALYPPLKKLRSRAMALELLNTRVADVVASRSPASGEVEAVREANEAVTKIRELIAEKFGTGGPSTRNLVEALKERTEQVGPSAPPPPGPGETPPPVAPAAQAAPQPKVQAPSTPGDAMQMVRRMLAVIREGKPTGSLAYRLLRCLKWDPLESEPPSPGGDGKTRVPAPTPATRTALERMSEAGNWEGLLNGCERAFQEAGGTFWLDVQRLACTALQSLGSDYDRVRDAIISETAILLERFPNLVNLSFADDVPFADDLTRTWIEEEVRRPAKQAPTVEVAPAGPTPAGEMDADLREAQKRAARKDLKGALDLLQHGIDAESSRRGRFMRKLAAAKLCLNSGQPAWAMRVLEGLDQEVDRLSLEQWEPDLCIDVWETLYRCYRKLLASRKVEMAESLRERAAHVRDKLFRLDFRSAVSAELDKK